MDFLTTDDPRAFRRGHVVWIGIREGEKLFLAQRFRVGVIADRFSARFMLRAREDKLPRAEFFIFPVREMATSTRDHLDITPYEDDIEFRSDSSRREGAVRVLTPRSARLLEALWTRGSHLPSEPDEVLDEELAAFEGKKRSLFKNHRHREYTLRQKKIQSALERQGSLKCEVPGCGFDFFETYGELGRNYAHVHHKRPLSVRASPELTKLSDLAIVCANCHAMIHLGGECRPLAKVAPKKR